MNKADYDKLCDVCENLLENLKQYRQDYIENEPEDYSEALDDNYI